MTSTRSTNSRTALLRLPLVAGTFLLLALLPTLHGQDRRRQAPPKPPKANVPTEWQTDSLKLPRLFCDNMVLLQETKNTVWGWAASAETVTVAASWGAKADATADAQGRWKLLLDTPKAGTGHTLTIAGRTDRITLRNVACGEVWLCAGQSNMGWSMGNSFEADREAAVDLPDFRIFRSAREHWHEPLDRPRDRLSQWKPCDPAAAAETSAVSYYFGKTLHRALGVPVGIIQKAYAGTPIEGWMPWDVQQDDPRAVAHQKSIDATSERQIRSRITRESALATWRKELDDYNARLDAGETMKNSVRPWSPPIITKPANLGHQAPAHQYNAMIHPVVPYGIRGVVWYQGERNAKNAPQASHYRKQLATLIRHYRTVWHQGSSGNTALDFPFQFTQLPSWTAAQQDPVEGLSAPWAVSREAMRLVTQDVPGTATAVTIDTGDIIDLHPKNKKPIGLRHALLALERTYGKDVVGSGPRFVGQTRQGAHLELRFESVGSGLMAATPGPLDAFAIAGADREWHWADARIEGDRVRLSSTEVPEPVAARYAWAMNPSQRNLLYNREGLPASPFRSDDWPLFDPAAELIEVAKPAKVDGRVATDWDRPPMTQLP